MLILAVPSVETKPRHSMPSMYINAVAQQPLIISAALKKKKKVVCGWNFVSVKMNPGRIHGCSSPFLRGFKLPLIVKPSMASRLLGRGVLTDLSGFQESDRA